MLVGGNNTLLYVGVGVRTLDTPFIHPKLGILITKKNIKQPKKNIFV